MARTVDHARLAASAAAHHGVLLPHVLDDAGVSLAQRRHRVTTGEWRRLSDGALVVAAVPETFEMLATAALAMQPAAVLSHQSAAHVHGIDLGRRIHLTVAPGGGTRHRGVVLHQSPLDPVDLTVRLGFRTTTLDRTLVDLGGSLGARALRRVIADQLIARTTTFERLEHTFLRLARPGRNGIARTRSTLAAIDGVPPTESELEDRFERLVRRAGLPAPERQVTLEWSPQERGRVDFWYPDAALIVEVDGRRFHARLEAFERDRQRDQRAMMAGMRTVRFGHRQVTREPSEVADVLRTLLALGPIG